MPLIILGVSLLFLLSGCDVTRESDFELCVGTMLRGKAFSATEQERITAIRECTTLRSQVLQEHLEKEKKDGK